MNQKTVFWETIEIFENQGVLEHIMLIGSWAEYVYQESQYLENFRANLRTHDVDWLIRNIRKPRQKIKLIEAMEAKGFVTEIDYINGVHKFHKGSDLEIEFLVREKGQGKSDAYEVESLGIKAIGLRNMEILLDNAVNIPCKGYCITVPSPQAYMLHKMVINMERKEKQEKDTRAIMDLLFYLEQSEEQMSILQIILKGLTKKQQIKVKKFAEMNNIIM